jgi:hypothetical protein
LQNKRPPLREEKPIFLSYGVEVKRTPPNSTLPAGPPSGPSITALSSIPMRGGHPMQKLPKRGSSNVLPLAARTSPSRTEELSASSAKIHLRT